MIVHAGRRGGDRVSARTSYADWIAVDWGTSHLRAWAMRDGAPRAEAVSDNGMAALQTDGNDYLRLRHDRKGAGMAG